MAVPVAYGRLTAPRRPGFGGNRQEAEETQQADMQSVGRMWTFLCLFSVLKTWVQVDVPSG